MRLRIVGTAAALALAATTARANEPPGHEHSAVHWPHVHWHHDRPASEVRDPFLWLFRHKPDSNAARQRRGEGPINRKPLAPNDFHNTGHPNELRPYAVPTVTPNYTGYYVGGGVGFGKGDPRCPHEGVWGWDYVGACIPRRIALLWSHGRRYQNGNGAYKNTYPYEYKNPFFNLESPYLLFNRGGAEEGGNGHGSAGHLPPH